MARQPPLTFPEPLPETIDEDIVEGSPPHVGAIPDHWFGVSRKRTTDETQQGTPSQAKKRKLVFTPSTGIVQALESPINPVPVEIEFLGFTPTSTTSATPGSGRSSMSCEIGADVDIERDLEEITGPNVGSDVEDDDYDMSLRQRDVFEIPVEFEDSEDHGLAEAVQRIDTAADVALRAVPESEDLLHFDWRGSLENFEGVKEEFIGPSGPTFDISG
ncbi:uncharacterized protein [Maniola hyperantus]|uniref:uncharacterized protein isoform X2 n=1 Tax=Aphantopus hyperantus TaxID=2795564 RepID=UPI00374A8563